jgi:GMP synthase (glutamine-hydrolysing)
MIANFVFGICACAPSWTMEHYLDEQRARLRHTIGDRSVFLLASGGVDSTVAAKVLGDAVGADRLHLLHIDNGLMRKDESRDVLGTLSALGLDRHLNFVDASGTFLRALDGVVEPERKRRIIGDTFIEVFESEARRLGASDHLLAQGTIYPDTIETGGTKRADTIKTHHNRVPIIQEMLAAGQVVEPLVDLYKVEVRELGEKLGIPADLIWRHPFPGPGLGVRLLCSSGHEDREHFDEIEPALASVSQRFGISAKALPIRSVGVKADLRSYEHPVLLAGARDWARLQEIAGAIYREVPHINRCIWWTEGAPPRDVRPRAATVTQPRLELLREADALVMDGLRRHGIYPEIWQCPTVLVPAICDGQGSELVIIRPIRSERGMTATAAELPSALVHELTRKLRSLNGVCGVAIDLTSKPPGTIEWE